ncbi:MAG: N-acetylmuramoyl-L-alanine amidase [Bacteroidia bacterium]
MKTVKKQVKRMHFWVLLAPFFAYSQNYSDIKSRYEIYLNYKNLEKYVEISPEKIVFFKYSGDKKEEDLILTKNTWPAVTQLVSFVQPENADKVFQKMKDPKLLAEIPKEKINGRKKIPEKPLSGLKICIDPGHIAGNMDMAETEQKFIHFSKEIYTDLKTDSVDIAEGVLTFQTASILKQMLQEKGAEVVLTRQDNCTTFGITYEEWYKKHKRKTLDSLAAIDKITPQKHKQLQHMNSDRFFVEFFKDYELQHRAAVINNSHPDLTVIIHYNVNEKNVPWLKPSDKDFCMAFVPGCITTDNIQSSAGKLNLLRLLLSEHVNESEKISALLVEELSRQLNIPVAKPEDATYLSEHCMLTPAEGVYSRNLALCRLVQSPLVYGECLYQDNNKECYELVKNTENFYGVQTNKRVVLSAVSFYKAILRYYSN